MIRSCTFCRVSSETVNHLFYECFHNNQFCKDSKTFLFTLSGEHVELSLQNVLIGKLEEVNDLRNDFLIIAKWHIWSSRKQSLSPNITVLKEIINMKYKTENYIALKTIRKQKFRPDGIYLLIVNYHLLYHRLKIILSTLVPNIIMLLTLNNSAVFCN